MVTKTLDQEFRVRKWTGAGAKNKSKQAEVIPDKINLTEYELERQRRIEENKAMMASFGLIEAKRALEVCGLGFQRPHRLTNSLTRKSLLHYDQQSRNVAPLPKSKKSGRNALPRGDLPARRHCYRQASIPIWHRHRCS